MLLKFMLTLVLGLLAGWAHATEKVLLVTYYQYAPWTLVKDPAAGLNAQLAAKLNARSHGRYHFTPTYIPRKRLDVLLRKPGTTMVVAWVHPRFFDDPHRTRYLWTGPLMEDQSLIASPRSAPLKYDGPASLRGKRFGAPAGHKFPDLDPFIANGEIIRVDVPQVRNALSMMVYKRNLDFTVVDRSDLSGLRGDPLVDQSLLHIAPTPRTAAYERCMLVPKNKPELHAFLNKTIAALDSRKGELSHQNVLRCRAGAAATRH